MGLSSSGKRMRGETEVVGRPGGIFVVGNERGNEENWSTAAVLEDQTRVQTGMEENRVGFELVMQTDSPREVAHPDRA